NEAPLRIKPVRRKNQDDGVTALDFLVEATLPVLAGLQPRMLVEIQEDLLVPVLRQPGSYLVGQSVIPARMTDEDGSHSLSTRIQDLAQTLQVDLRLGPSLNRGFQCSRIDVGPGAALGIEAVPISARKLRRANPDGCARISHQLLWDCPF